MANKKSSIVISITVGLLSVQAHATAENLFSLHGGSAFTQSSGLHITQSGLGTGLVLHDAEWGVRPFTPVPYYGVRLTHVDRRYPNWSASLDFSRYDTAERSNGSGADSFGLTPSATALTAFDRSVLYTGASQAASVLSVNAVYRWRDTRDPSLSGFRWEPYIGAGLSRYWQHGDDSAAGLREVRQASSGFGYQLTGGVRFSMTERLGAFVEAKFNGGNGYVDGQTDVTPRNFHALAGVGLRF